MQGSSGFALPLAVLLVAATAHAGDGRVEISHAAILAAGGYPRVIAQPGSYVLTSNLDVPEGEIGISIAASDVTLDLNGFRIAGPEGCSAGDCADAAVEFSGLQSGHRVTLRNGIIRGFSGICVQLRDFAHVTGLYVSECGQDGISVGRWALVTENRVSQSGENGIRMQDGSSAYAHNVVSGAGQGAPGKAIARGKPSAGNSCDDGSCTSDGRRRYYLTTGTFQGDHGANDCAAGFHMASIFELLDASSLAYDTGLGVVANDSGSGPPLGPPNGFAQGWARTGSSNADRCASGLVPWASSSSLQLGTFAGLDLGYSGPAFDFRPSWKVGGETCNGSLPIWCIED